MNKQALIEESTAWCPEHKLPLIPEHNNPGIYCALMVWLCKFFPDTWRERFEFFWKSAVYPRISRFPGGRGGNFSHDEIIGWAYLSKEAADFLLHRLEKWWGWFPNEHGKFELARFFYRFIFLKPYLLMRCEKPLSWFWEKMWCLHVSHSTKKTTRESFDTDGIIKIRLMGESTGKYPRCHDVYLLWLNRLRDLEIDPDLLFEEYLKEVPIVRELAKERKF